MEKINELWQEYKKTHDEKIHEQLVKNYLPLVKYLVDNILYHLPLNVKNNEKEDLFIEGIIGLMDAMERFDLQKNVKFETYASKRIRGSVLDVLRHEDILPKNVRETAKKIEQAYIDFESKTGRTASDDEITKELRMTKEEFYVILDKVKGISLLSMESEIFNKNGEKFFVQDIIGEDNRTLFEFEKEEIVKYLAQFIDELEAEERIVLEMYYWDELTLKEIGVALKVSESRICQIHTKIILRLRSRFKKLEKAR